jgi:hypothetical protein
MANMSYCRFQNTSSDLADCVNALDRIAYDGESISRREWAKAKAMREWCEQFIELMDEIDEDEVTFED